MNFVSVLSTAEAFSYLNSSWHEVIDWLRKLLTMGSSVLADYFQAELNSYLTRVDLNEAHGTKFAKVFALFTDLDESLTRGASLLLVERLVSLNKYVYTPNHKAYKVFFFLSTVLKFTAGGGSFLYLQDIAKPTKFHAANYRFYICKVPHSLQSADR